MTFTVGQRVRHTKTGVVGTIKAFGADPAGVQLPDGTPIPVAQVQLTLDKQHLDHTPEVPQGHDNRWYPEAHIEETDDESKS
jgi:hypothetical protein